MEVLARAAHHPQASDLEQQMAIRWGDVYAAELERLTIGRHGHQATGIAGQDVSEQTRGVRRSMHDDAHHHRQISGQLPAYAGQGRKAAGRGPHDDDIVVAHALEFTRPAAEQLKNRAI